IQLKDLQDKIRLGYNGDRIGVVEGQLRSELAAVEAQLARLRAQYTDSHPKTAEMRNLRNALQRELNSIRSARSTSPRPGLNRGPAASPKAKVATTAGGGSSF